MLLKFLSIRACLNNKNQIISCSSKLLSKLLSSTSHVSSYHSLSSPTRSSINNLHKLLKPNTQNSNNQIILIKRYNSRFRLKDNPALRSANQNVLLYATAGVIVVLALSYAAVPLYRIYCQSTGKGGVPFIDTGKVEKMKVNKERLITVMFNADTSAMVAWDFKPTQSELVLAPGEKALAFYTAKNPLSTPITGISTYSVVPYEAGLYLNKIQCFCFEEQLLNPNEEVEMPVFFYIDPEYAEDPRLENVDNIVLSYTFFEAKKGMSFPFSINANETISVKQT